MLKRLENGYQEVSWPSTWDDFWEFNNSWGLVPDLTLKLLALGYYARQVYGINLWIISGKRSVAEQLRLQRANPQWYTDPSVPSSYHLKGRAADLGSDFTLSRTQWQQVGELGEALGLRWGGRFRTPDNPHFDLGSGL
jgi:hypothetical protein